MSDQETAVPQGISVPREQVSEEELRALDIDLARDFPQSTASDFRRYPVLSEGGWYLVIKHQKTLVSVAREPWHLLGPITLTSAGLDVN